MYRLSVASLNLSPYLSEQVSPVNFSLSAGEIVTLTGPSGVGKSVLLKAITDLIRAEGKLVLNETETREQLSAQVWRQQVMLFPAQSVWWESVMQDHFEPDALSSVKAMMAQLALPENLLHKPVSQLSTGQKQRFSLIRGLILKPVVLLFDEPTATLDPETTEAVESLVKNYTMEHQAAVIWVSHDHAQCQRLGQRHFTFNEQGLGEVAA